MSIVKDFLSQAPRYFEAWGRGFNVKGNLPNGFEPKARLTVQLSDLDQPEFGPLRGERRLCAGAFQNAAVAQAFALTAALLPTAPKTIVIVERIILTTTALAQSYAIGFGTGSTAVGVLARASMDERTFTGAGQLSLLDLNSQNLAGPAIVAGGITYNVAPNTNYIVEGPWVLTGKMFPAILQVIAGTPNQFGGAGIVWRERPRGQQESI